MSGRNGIIGDEVAVVKNTRVRTVDGSVVMTVGRVGRGWRQRVYSPDDADQLALHLFAKAAQARLKAAADRSVAP
jgi:hypothetical protein